MEIKYQSDYVAKDRSFSIGTIGLLSGYALQISEPRPRLAEGKLAPGEQCMILFGITKEEHDLKDTDLKALAQLAADLRREVPKDRVIATIVMDLTGKPVKKQIKLQTGESIDNGAFLNKYRVQAGPIDSSMVEARKLQDICAKKDTPSGVREDWNHTRANVARALLNLERVFVPYDTLLKSRYPYVREGRVELFTTLDRANKAMARVKAFNFGEDAWFLKEIAKADLPAFLDTCTEMGLNALRLDTTTLDVALFIKDISERETPRNAALRGCVIQEIACGTRFDQLKNVELKEVDRRRITERVLTLRNFSHREIGNAVLWSVGGVNGPVNGKLCTPKAMQKLDNAPELQSVANANHVMVKLKNNDGQFLTLFTSEIRALSFAEKLNDSPRPILMTFDDACDLVRRIPAASGIILDVDDFGYRVTKEQFDSVLDLRSKPPQIVRIKEPVPKPEEVPAPREAALPNPDLNALPDPDLSAPAKAESNTDPAVTDDTSISTKESTDDKKKEKGGFFRKLFGKK